MDCNTEQDNGQLEPYKFPDTILAEIIYHSHPVSLYWIWIGVSSDYQFIKDNEKEVRELPKNKFIINRLCEEKGVKKLDTFEEFLLEWDEWNLDKEEIPPSYFKRRWELRTDSLKLLYYLGRNARKNSSWLEIADLILDSGRLWCSEVHIRELCKGLFWSHSFILEYTEKMRFYNEYNFSPIETNISLLTSIKSNIEEETKKHRNTNVSIP